MQCFTVQVVVLFMALLFLSKLRPLSSVVQRNVMRFRVCVAIYANLLHVPTGLLMRLQVTY